MKLKSMTWVLVVSLVPMMATAGKGASPSGKPFIELQGQIIEVEGEVSSLQDQVDSLVDKVDSLDGKVLANEAAIVDLQNQIADIQDIIATYDSTNIDLLASEIENLKTENQDLRLLVENGDASLQDQVDANEALITVLQQTVSELTDLQSQVDNNYALIGFLQDEITIIRDLLNGKQNIINGTCPDGTAIQEVLTDGSVVCNNAGSGNSGGIETKTVIKYETLSPGEYKLVTSFCQDGWTAVNSGYSLPTNTVVFQSYTGTYIDPTSELHGKSFGLVTPRNMNGYSITVRGVVTCMRIAP